MVSASKRDDYEGDKFGEVGSDIVVKTEILQLNVSGAPVSAINPLPVDAIITIGDEITIVPGTITGRTFSYEDTSFLTGDSPIVLDVNTDLGRNSVDGYIVNDGDGNFTIEVSNDGTTYGGVHTLKKGDVFNLQNLDVDKIRITWIANSAYRVGVA